MSDAQRPLETIGLGGDGDEVEAIVAIERHFGISLDYGDASNWVTAGELFGSVLKALPADRAGGEDLWPQFARNLCEETGADPSRVAAETLLLAMPLRTLAGRRFGRVRRAGRIA